MALRRTGFKQKATKPMKRSGFKRKAKTRSQKPQNRSGRKKTAQKGYVVPKWFNAIKLGSHGNTPAQKRYWKVLSDTYREEDYKTYNGKCPLCHRHIEDWKQLQLGHFHRWSVCNSWFKFERRNLLSICASCNVNDGGLTSYRFAEVLKQKYGEQHIEWIEKTNEAFRGQKMETWEIVSRVEELRPDLIK